MWWLKDLRPSLPFSFYFLSKIRAKTSSWDQVGEEYVRDAGEGSYRPGGSESELIRTKK